MPGTPRGRGFEKGRSGNPAGRPRRAAVPAPSPFAFLITETIPAVVGGKASVLSARDALAHALYRQAVKGNARAQRRVIAMIRLWSDARAALAPKRTVGAGLNAFYNDREREAGPVLGKSLHAAANADPVTLLLGIGVADPAASDAGDKPSWQLLATWVVAEGLKRQRGKLDAGDLMTIRGLVADPGDIEWPDPT